MSQPSPFSASGMKQRWSRLWHGRRCLAISEPDPTYKVVYLGNVVTQWAKGEGCADKPLATLWRNHCASARAKEIHMKLTVTNSGLKATTKEHGLTEYWASRITHCAAPPAYPRLFCWVFRHEGRRMRPELRCHAVLCEREAAARQLAEQLDARLSAALQEFRREKLSRQKARLSSLAQLPRRKQLLSRGAANFRPPLERSKSAPRLTAIDEEAEEEDEDDLLLLYGDEDEFLAGLESELESTSDLVPDDSLSDYLSTTDSDSVEDAAPGRTRRTGTVIRLAGETLDEEEDTVSDESGYSEETKLSFREDTSVRM